LVIKGFYLLSFYSRFFLTKSTASNNPHLVSSARQNTPSVSQGKEALVRSSTEGKNFIQSSAMMQIDSLLFLSLLVLGSLSMADGRLRVARHRNGMNMKMSANPKIDAFLASVELIPAEEDEEEKKESLLAPLQVHVRALQLKEIEGLGSNPVESFPLQMCQGDCDQDSDVSLYAASP
jgi:hypothetical protein